jgi:hypothetical protein
MGKGSPTAPSDPEELTNSDRAGYLLAGNLMLLGFTLWLFHERGLHFVYKSWNHAGPHTTGGVLTYFVWPEAMLIVWYGLVLWSWRRIKATIVSVIAWGAKFGRATVPTDLQTWANAQGRELPRWIAGLTIYFPVVVNLFLIAFLIYYTGGPVEGPYGQVPAAMLIVGQRLMTESAASAAAPESATRLSSSLRFVLLALLVVLIYGVLAFAPRPDASGSGLRSVRLFFGLTVLNVFLSTVVSLSAARKERKVA